MRITPSSPVLRILHGLKSFSASGAVPGDVPLEPTDTLLGVLAFAGNPAIVLLDLGAYLKIEDEWHFVPYAAMEVRLPIEELPASPLVLVTPHGSVEFVSGANDAREAGRFFMKCAEEAGAVRYLT